MGKPTECPQVVNIVTTVVDMLPDEAYIDDMPSSPPLCSPKDSSDSLPSELYASSSQEYPGHQVVMELLHTERKYVQDLETMQVRDCLIPRFGTTLTGIPRSDTRLRLRNQIQ